MKTPLEKCPVGLDKNSVQRPILTVRKVKTYFLLSKSCQAVLFSPDLVAKNCIKTKGLRKYRDVYRVRALKKGNLNHVMEEKVSTIRMKKLKQAFFKSLTTVSNTLHSVDELKAWIKQRNNEVHVKVEKIPFSQLSNWSFDKDGSLRHSSGRFFSIEGIEVETDVGTKKKWSQPIINQPEIGYLGIITKEINGVLYFLMQAKIEPGNVNCVQISPTLQATKSNYSQVHHGNRPSYLEYFQSVKPQQVLLDQLQSEQGSRFFRKRNRNIIIKVDEDIEVLENFKWITLGQLKLLMELDNIINMDTRTVISGINYCVPKKGLSGDISGFGKDLLRSLRRKNGLFTIDNHLSWLSGLKSKYEITVKQTPLKNICDWVTTDKEIHHKDQHFFRVIGVNVTISNREISSWCQPLIDPRQEGLCAFLIKKIDGVYHFLVQAKLECGNFDIVELAPTVQCLIRNVKNKSIEKPFFYDDILKLVKESAVYDTMQSEEGGRFYKEQNRNIIVEADQYFSNDVPENYTWMTLGQLNKFLRFNNYLNSQSRSLLAALKYTL
ncbi:MAG: oxidase EvaA [Cognaticolwellia sp.]|jgi:oxidase EvaA